MIIESYEYVPRPNLRPMGLGREIISTLVFLVAVFTLLQLAIPRSVVHGRSMQPSFQEGQRLVISRLNYLFGSPHRGDIVIFNSPDPLTPDEPSLIKRIIGLPGDVIEFREKQLYINGVLTEEPYINEAQCRKCPDQKWELGDNEYFMMGDNRNNSRDSREFGPVPAENLIGEAIFRFWPIGNLGVVDHYRFPSSFP